MNLRIVVVVAVVGMPLWASAQNADVTVPAIEGQESGVAPAPTPAPMPGTLTAAKLPAATPTPAPQAEPVSVRGSGVETDVPAQPVEVEGPPKKAKRTGAPPRPKYTALESQALGISREWQRRASAPARSEAGVVTFVYGDVLPSVVCSPLFVCDIVLQTGEVVSDLHAGDQARWKVSIARSGGAGAPATHVLVKPTDAGLRTNLLIMTDRRTYTVQLVSDDKDWMPRVAFTYPEDTAAQLAAYQRRAQVERASQELPEGHQIAELDFGFKLSGDSPPWKPVRVYTDSVKTYIEFPAEMRNADAPALLEVGPDEREQIVNYRVQGTRYIVDKALQKAWLVFGVGGTQQKVTVERVVKVSAGGRP